MDTLLGQGRRAIDLIFDKDSFKEDEIGNYINKDKTFGPGAITGTAALGGEICTVIANDAEKYNEKFPVVYSGIIGMEEAYKMSIAVYETIKADADKSENKKRPIILIVDTPGNGPGKQEEIFGMNKATGSYQLALAEARLDGHPVIAMVVGRAISGAFLCHGLQADTIIALSEKFGTMIHVMPLTSISRITKLNIEKLNIMAAKNPVFAAGPSFFYKLGGVEILLNRIEDMSNEIKKQVKKAREAKEAQGKDSTGPWHRGIIGEERGGRKVRIKVMQKMETEFAAVADKYI